MPLDDLLDKRYAKFRTMAQFYVSRPSVDPFLEPF